MITSFLYEGFEKSPWSFRESSFDKINLLVGASGAGKTRFLSTLFNFSMFVVKGEPAKPGYFKISVVADGFEYEWEFEAKKPEGDIHVVVTRESLTRRKLNGKGAKEHLIKRTPEEFIFNDKILPKLQKNIASITLLKEEDTILPLYESFSKIQRRSFHDKGLMDAISVQMLQNDFLEIFKSHSTLENLWVQEHTVSSKLYLLKEFFPKIFKESINVFKTIFPTMEEFDVKLAKNPPLISQSGGIVPVFSIKEKGVSKWIPLNDLASGMQKVLLIITDILTLPPVAIYIIDEYENSLGVNAIDFLPQFLIEHGGENQFFITTHHPYLINNMPLSTWRVFHRKGSQVSIRCGKELGKNYEKSKQKAFIQLINDPFYTQGIQ